MQNGHSISWSTCTYFDRLCKLRKLTASCSALSAFLGLLCLESSLHYLEKRRKKFNIKLQSNIKLKRQVGQFLKFTLRNYIYLSFYLGRLKIFIFWKTLLLRKMQSKLLNFLKWKLVFWKPFTVRVLLGIPVNWKEGQACISIIYVNKKVICIWKTFANKVWKEDIWIALWWQMHNLEQQTLSYFRLYRQAYRKAANLAPCQSLPCRYSAVALYFRPVLHAGRRLTYMVSF